MTKVEIVESGNVIDEADFSTQANAYRFANLLRTKYHVRCRCRDTYGGNPQDYHIEELAEIYGTAWGR